MNSQGILFDLDGVLYNSEEPIAGAAEAVKWVCSQGLPHLFLTNTTSRSRAPLLEKLHRFGIPAAADQILSPCVVAAEWLRAQGPVDIAAFIRPAARSEFTGLRLLPEDAETGAAYVVVGDLGAGWDYRTLNRAFRLLHHNPAAELIALGMTRYWQTPEGLSLDTAPFVAALEHATGRTARVFGKPAAAFFQAAADRLGLPANRCLMVGDDIRTDIGGAQGAGMRAALVQTGKFRPSDLDGNVKPDAVLASVAELPNWWGRLGDVCP